MHISIVRRRLVLAGCAAGLAWGGAGQALSASIKVPLNTAQCVPAVETSATGTAELTYDPATRVVTWNIAFDGLSSPATMAHIHGPAEPGKNAPVLVWLSKQGSPPISPMTGQATLTAEQARELGAGRLYVNLHTQSHPACELRGQIPATKS